MSIRAIDITLVHFFRRVSVPVARFGLFVVFFWFGALKVLGLSPASGLVQRLFENTIHFVSFDHFLIFFGLFSFCSGEQVTCVTCVQDSKTLVMFCLQNHQGVQLL
jgi:uncharacterized membrane protein YkgB